MKIQLMSDLHLEAHPLWRAQPAPGADLLVLAGDVGSYQAGSQLADEDFGLRQFSPKLGWPTPVLFVPGNHEYDTFDFDQAHERLRETCERLGITWLERQVLHWPVPAGERPVRFVGTTLWSDFNALNTPLALSSKQKIDTHSGAKPIKPSAQPDPLKARDKAYKAANYYLEKTFTRFESEPMLAPQVRTQALRCQAWLRDALAQPFDGDTVVVTHFAPSLHSADPRYGLTPGTAGFCNALDDLLPHAKLWLHGHLHCASNYVHHGCRVVANPLGYARKNEQAGFLPMATVEV